MESYIKIDFKVGFGANQTLVPFRTVIFWLVVGCVTEDVGRKQIWVPNSIILATQAQWQIRVDGNQSS